jgi:predicted RNA binding protein YcfA (HicA-like mRNA interferase family)
VPPKPEQFARKLRKLGFEERTTRGGHRVFLHPDGRRTVLPFHSGELSRQLYLEILKQIRLTEDEYREL